eukprot:4755070-Pleurochrysis_carterae.AAC.3
MPVAFSHCQNELQRPVRTRSFTLGSSRLPSKDSRFDEVASTRKCAEIASSSIEATLLVRRVGSSVYGVVYTLATYGRFAFAR